MEIKHTPGPWVFRSDVTDQGFYIETLDKTHRKTFIADIGGGLQSMEEIKANAKLIAEAPEMLKAIISINKKLQNIATGYPQTDRILTELWELTNELIKKATE